LRLSYFKAFVVQSFCLGHSAYVSSVVVYKNRVFSSGGDSTVHEWNIENGGSVAHSEKLGDDPVRRLRILPKEDLFYMVVIAGSRLIVLDGKLQLIKNIEVSSEIMDITVQEGNVVGVTRFVNFTFLKSCFGASHD
ncbi:hypothetical protein OESDEN_17286, partial [Oesophagostomum dentatum]